jgi:hypothetical protein
VTAVDGALGTVEASESAELQASIDSAARVDMKYSHRLDFIDVG